MRKISTSDFKIAKRTTSRDINRRIALNLIRAHEPISRADLARRMNLERGVITVLINELIGKELIFENALRAIEETGRYLGCGLAMIINTLNLERIYIGGEITSAWDLIQAAVGEAAARQTLTEAGARTLIQTAPTNEYPRRRGAAALIVAPNFAALEVA